MSKRRDAASDAHHALTERARRIADVTNTRERQAINQSTVRDLEAWQRRLGRVPAPGVTTS